MKISSTISVTVFEKWNEFISNHCHNTVFQSPEMYSFYEKVKNFTPYVFIAEEKNEIKGILLAVLIKEGKGIKGYFSSRVVIYGGPLIDAKNNLEVLDLLLKELVKKLKNKSVFIQFRNFYKWEEHEKQVFAKYNFVFRERLNLLINTKSENTVWSQISKSRRRQIRLGLKNGSKIEEPKSESDVKRFYELLYNLYKNKVRKPLPDWSFFREFYYLSKKGKLGIILLVKLGNKIIGGILSPITQKKVAYEWYVVGLDKEYKKNYPSVLATWALIHFALQNEIQFFDFMGLGVPQKEYGVRTFKKKFGGEMVNYGRFARRNNKFLYKVAEFGYNLLRLKKTIK